jgi:hypothetical protein
MAYIQKYNILLNHVKKKSKKFKIMTHKDAAQYLFETYKQMNILIKKEKIENIIHDIDMEIILNNIFNNDGLFSSIKLPKKIKKEFLLSLMTDIIKYIENHINIDKNIVNMISLYKTTKFIFGKNKNFVINAPVIYKCNSKTLKQICDIIKNKNLIIKNKIDNIVYDIDKMIENIHIKEEFHKLIRDN